MVKSSIKGRAPAKEDIKGASVVHPAEEDTLCQFCKEEEDTSIHVLCQCKSLARLRFLKLDKEKPK